MPSSGNGMNDNESGWQLRANWESVIMLSLWKWPGGGQLWWPDGKYMWQRAELLLYPDARKGGGEDDEESPSLQATLSLPYSFNCSSYAGWKWSRLKSCSQWAALCDEERWGHSKYVYRSTRVWLTEYSWFKQWVYLSVLPTFSLYVYNIHVLHHI